MSEQERTNLLPSFLFAAVQRERTREEKERFAFLSTSLAAASSSLVHFGRKLHLTRQVEIRQPAKGKEEASAGVCMSALCVL